MGIINSISQWSQSRYEKKVAKARNQGNCPDCNGRGVEILPYEHFYSTSYQCPGCDGSGQFSDWLK